MRRAARAASEPAGSGMSTWAARRPVRLPQAGAAASEAESLRLRMCAFFALASFAVLQYGALLVHPPSARLLAIAAVVTVGGGALTLSSRLPSRRLALAAALAVSLATLALALLVLGVPAHLLLPSRWATLVRDLRGGLRALEGWLWPYRGGREWTRLAVLLPVPVGLTCAAALCFWPSRHIVATRTAALSLLIALFITGAANQPDAAWGVQGSVLAALTAAWLWLPSLAAADLNRAGAWVVICSTLALLLAPLLSARRPWIHYRTWNAAHATTSFQWDQASGPITWSRSNLTMFELQAPRPQLLRVTALDRFDGRRFLRSPAPPGDSRVDIPRTHERSWLSTATVRVGGLRSELLVSDGGLPVAARWLGRRADTDTITAQPDGEAVFRSAPVEGDSYQVLSYAPAASVAALRNARRSFPSAYLAYTRFELPPAESPARGLERAAGAARRGRLQGLPPGGAAATESGIGAPAPGRAPVSDAASVLRIAASPYAPMFALARRLAAGARTEYDLAARIERYLRENYTYDEHIPRDHYPLEAFLFKDRRGYCQQFAGAMALMLRMDGVPARIAAGFRPGVYDTSAHRWRVRALDAHSWVEVYFAGVGWVPFDPTPSRGGSSPVGEGAGSASKAGVSSALGSRPSAGGASTAGAGHRRGHASGGGGVPWLLLSAAALLPLLLATACWWLLGARRLRRALAGDANGAVVELRAALNRIGYPGCEGKTLAALEHELRHSRRVLARRYLSLLRELRYGRERSPRPRPRERRELRRALADGGGMRRRLRALLALPPGAARRVSR
ncbi:MAG: transglutaminase domain-containing protein [Actinobacteria bacterium]|nr:MAG: transglutaminase domain-containing protein [Actinomycetota bacterium]